MKTKKKQKIRLNNMLGFKPEGILILSFVGFLTACSKYIPFFPLVPMTVREPKPGSKLVLGVLDYRVYAGGIFIYVIHQALYFIAKWVVFIYTYLNILIQLLIYTDKEDRKDSESKEKSKGLIDWIDLWDTTKPEQSTWKQAYVVGYTSEDMQANHKAYVTLMAKFYGIHDYLIFTEPISTSVFSKESIVRPIDKKKDPKEVAKGIKIYNLR